MSIEWRQHPYLLDYEVSSIGGVRRLTPARTRRAAHVVRGHARGGYWSYKLAGAHGKATYWAHRLVAETFIGLQPTSRHVIAHQDGNRLNNHHPNLRWATHVENCQDTARHGSLKGTNNGRSTLNEEAVRQLRHRYSGRWGEQSALAREYGMSHSAMRSTLVGEHWTHVNG